MQRLAQFWKELRRRKVIKANAMYAATAFIIMEAADIMLPRLGLPDWTVTLIIVLLIIGFPISIILSWIFDVTPEGFRKTETMDEDSEKMAPQKPLKRGFRGSDAVIAVMFIIVCILLYPKVFNRDKFESIRQEDGRISIAVMPFQNMTNDTLWNVWQVGIQNELISNLSNSTELSVRQYQTMQEILQNTDQVNYASISPTEASEISRKLDANTFIQGGIKSAGKEIRLNVQLVDANSEEIFKTFQVEGSSEDDIFIITDSLSRLVRNYLEIRVLEQDVEYDLRSGNTTNSADAYRDYIEGLNLYFSGDSRSAIERLNQSIQTDPEFFAAYDWLLVVYNSYGYNQQDYSQIEHAKQLLRKIINWEVDRLSNMEQLSLKMIISKYVDKNPQDYIQFCRQMLNYDPQQRIIWFNLGEAYSSIQQFENAIKAFERAVEISNQWEVNDKWVRTYKGLGNAYYNLGDYQQENEVYELGLKYFPDNPEITINQLRSALIQGDTSEVNRYFNSYKSARQAENFWSHAEVLHRVAHQYAEANLLDEAEEIWKTVMRLEPQTTYHERCFAEFLILNDVNVDKGLDYINGILAIYPDYYDILFFKGVGLYKQGQMEEALETLKIAWNKRFTYRHDHYLALQEVKKALANKNN